MRINEYIINAELIEYYDYNLDVKDSKKFDNIRLYELFDHFHINKRRRVIKRLIKFEYRLIKIQIDYYTFERGIYVEVKGPYELIFEKSPEGHLIDTNYEVGKVPSLTELALTQSKINRMEKIHPMIVDFEPKISYVFAFGSDKKDQQYMALFGEIGLI